MEAFSPEVKELLSASVAAAEGKRGGGGQKGRKEGGDLLSDPLGVAEDEDEQSPEEDGDDSRPDEDHDLHVGLVARAWAPERRQRRQSITPPRSLPSP